MLLAEVIENRLGVTQTVTGQALEGQKRSLAANRASRALLHGHAGRVDAARAEVALARSLDPQCLLLDELDRLLGAQTGTGVAAA